MQRGLSFPGAGWQISRVSGAAQRDVWKTWLYAAGAVCLGAWLAPRLFNAGKALADVAGGRVTAGWVDRLADICRDAAFPAYFQAALLIAAAALFFPWMAWLGNGRGERRPGGESPWSLRLPRAAALPDSGQPLGRHPLGPLQAATGFLLAAGLFGLLGVALLKAGSFAWRDAPGPSNEQLATAFVIALGLAVLQEVLFRGVVLGIFLRATRPAAAISLAAVLFAGVRLLAVPEGLSVPDAEAGNAGFRMLALVFARLGDPVFAASTALPWLGLGAILGCARWRTASLWLPVGLHAGWIFADEAFRAVAVPLERADRFAASLAGPTLWSGLIPLTCIVFTGVLVWFLTLNRARDAAAK